jgi:hypothetical protein
VRSVRSVLSYAHLGGRALPFLEPPEVFALRGRSPSYARPSREERERVLTEIVLAHGLAEKFGGNATLCPSSNALGQSAVFGTEALARLS